jgi:LPS export ABC transporter protein LptC
MIRIGKLYLVVFCCLALAGCTPKTVPPSTNAPSNDHQVSNSQTEENPASKVPDGQFGAENLTIAKRDLETGKMLWEIKAKKGSGQAKDGKVTGTLQQVQGVLYKDGKPTLRFEAEHAKADSNEKRVTVWGRVKAFSNANKAELTAEKITWESKRDLITAEGNVRIKWGDFEMFDNRLHMDTALQRAWRSN